MPKVLANQHRSGELHRPVAESTPTRCRINTDPLPNHTEVANYTDPLPNYTDPLPNYTQVATNYTQVATNYTQVATNYTDPLPNYTEGVR